MTTHPIDAWHQLLDNQDPGALDTLLAESVVFVSPVVHTPQQGKALTMAYLSAAFGVLFNDSFRYVREIRGESDAMLEFETEIDGILVNGVDIIHWDDAGQITEFKVMVRPLKAINIVHQKMREMLAAMAGEGVG
ncbi:nuclear transport factor 2 family protein [Parahaliea maris]|uniref:Nuclear transport factor 2 family protein n=1 Tax=Parahaliea maris TaxID=2716870 RepID=A0A5C8ZP40_9GAMM|nr:nuclear transport factor 2 family protein [Parahaliea maris]TXS89502.1 nuclear transport factor 2 family protein [Parahaliea maris]